jgi:hypothetical protein
MPSMLSRQEILNAVAGLPIDLPDNWTIFGSAALLLNGIEGIETTDIDILIPSQNLSLHSEIPQQGSTLFSSEERKIYEIQGISVDVSWGLQVWSGKQWNKVEILEVVEKDGLRYASLPDCIRLLKLFGRPKDLQRLSFLLS